MKKEPKMAIGERTPPHDLEAEQGLLGSMMLDPLCIADVLQVLGSEGAGVFYRIDHRELYKIVLAMQEQGTGIDLTTVRDALRTAGKLEQVGGEEYLIALAEAVPHTANAKYYADIVQEKAWLRELIVAGSRIVQTAYQADGRARDVLDEAAKRILDITVQRKRSAPVGFNEFLEETFAHLADRRSPGITGLSCGLLALDDILCGLQKSELLVIAARPTVGKTSLALQMALHLASVVGRPTAFFSLEMPKAQVGIRSLCMMARIDSHRLRRGMLDMYELDAMQETVERLRSAPMWIDDEPGLTPLELRAKARRLYVEHDLAALFVDYLQLMQHPGAENRQCEIAFISASLKRLARELDIPVIACAQLNRQPESRKDLRPRLSDLRESGAVEQDADTVLLIHRPEVTAPHDPRLAGQAEIIVAKQRNGPTATLPFVFEKRWVRFDNATAPGPGPTREPQAQAEPKPDDAPF